MLDSDWQKLDWSTTNVPDSGTRVVVIHEDRPRIYNVVSLESTDDSEGHGEPYWEDLDGDTIPFEAYTHWFAPAESPQPKAQGDGWIPNREARRLEKAKAPK